MQLLNIGMCVMTFFLCLSTHAMDEVYLDNTLYDQYQTMHAVPIITKKSLKKRKPFFINNFFAQPNYFVRLPKIFEKNGITLPKLQKEFQLVMQANNKQLSKTETTVLPKKTPQKVLEKPVEKSNEEGFIIRLPKSVCDVILGIGTNNHVLLETNTLQTRTGKLSSKQQGKGDAFIEFFLPKAELKIIIDMMLCGQKKANGENEQKEIIPEGKGNCSISRG